jgi:hypothetical protein
MKRFDGKQEREGGREGGGEGGVCHVCMYSRTKETWEVKKNDVKHSHSIRQRPTQKSTQPKSAQIKESKVEEEERERRDPQKMNRKKGLGGRPKQSKNNQTNESGQK